MADIVSLKPPAKTKRRHKLGVSAQIIIFPGVRIERREFAIGDRQSTKPGTFSVRRRRTK